VIRDRTSACSRQQRSRRGAGLVSYTIQLEDGAGTGDTISAQARVFFQGAAPRIRRPSRRSWTLRRPRPTRGDRVAPGQPNYLVEWDVTDDAGGSGFRHVTLYSAEDGGNFTMWQRQLPVESGSQVFVGQAGHSYEFLALATDAAGNRESPPAGLLAPDDAAGEPGLPHGARTDAANYGIAPSHRPSLPPTRSLSLPRPALRRSFRRCGCRSSRRSCGRLPAARS